MPIVLDTSVLLAGLTSPRGASYQILSQAIEGTLICAATPALWTEYEEQLHSERFLDRTPLSVTQIDDFLDYLASVIQPVRNEFVWRGILEEDAIVAESAYNANADVLVTLNVDHFQTIREQVSFQIQPPGEFLKIWKGQST